MEKICLEDFKKEMNIRPLTEEQIRHLFKQLDDEGWEILEDRFEATREEIITVFIEIIIRRDQFQ